MTQPTHAVIALLRGINVGGKNRLPMAALRRIAEDAGFGGAATYVQSGNLVVPAVEPGSIGRVGTVLHDAIRTATGLDVTVITRTAGEWDRVIATNPFPDAVDDGTKLHVLFLDQPAVPSVRAFDAGSFEPERLWVTTREIYLSLPGGVGRSRLAAALTRRGAAAGTMRNWNTVLALADLARELGAADPG